MCARAARATSNAASPRGTAPSFMTAAHATLPIPSYVQVTNLRNGRRVVVKVNDRGPFHENRLIDLSYVAALKLGIADADEVDRVTRELDALGIKDAHVLID